MLIIEYYQEVEYYIYFVANNVSIFLSETVPTIEFS